jgi:trehalose/maltose hydrolase-like predicted phosphorylase
VAPLTAEELTTHLAWPSVGVADLLLTDSRDSEAVVIDEAGVHHVTGLDRMIDLTEVAVDTVDIGWGAAGDVAIGTMAELWRRGVDPGDVLLLMDGSPESPRPVAPVPVADVTTLLFDGGRSSPAAAGYLTGGSAPLRLVLADQLRRRRQRSLPEAVARSGWSLVVNDHDIEHELENEALLTLADGHVGTSGAPLAAHESQHPWVVAAGIYDGEGIDTQLLTGPRVFELAGLDSGVRQRILDLRTGVIHERSGAEERTVESVRFASMAQPTTSVLRVRCPKGLRVGPPLLPPADHPVHDRGRSGVAHWIRVAASAGGIAAAATQRRTRGQAGTSTLDRLAVYRTDADTLPAPETTLDDLSRADNAGFDQLLSRHRRAWARRWEDADVVVEGDDEWQRAIRLALFHLMASAPDTGEAAVGPRGLTGTGYRGHVFWDADIFVLPFLAATHPASARAMLEYRLRRLPVAIDAARAAGRSGARFPWESARTGRDVTPTSRRDGTGQIISIRTGQLEEHIVADVAWAACCYVDWSGDDEFAHGPGRRILVETARYWTSRIRREPDGRAHIDGVIGPDEYHESVDDNAYTNVMARWNLRRAAEVDGTDPVGSDEQQRWLELADALVDGYDPDTGIYEQFAGFGRLEPLIIEEVAPRRPVDADLLLGRERVAGAQVIKQADVLLLHHLVPDEVVPGSLEPNLRFYEPRTAHGSSLSPATHASLLARAGNFDKALEALRLAARMDLDGLTGSGAGGLHLATMGGLWQALAFGFAGLRPRAGILHMDPVLPPSWSALDLRVRFHGSRVRVRVEPSRLTIHTDRSTAIMLGSRPVSAGPGTLAFLRRGQSWEPIS